MKSRSTKTPKPAAPAFKAFATPHPPTDRVSPFYVSNRAPLAPNPLIKLPLDSIKAQGWLGHQLELMVNGMVGRLSEISEHLRPGNGWLGGNGPGWEEQPCWLRGFYDLAILTSDDRLLQEAGTWINAVLESGDSDGWFGPRPLRDATRDGAPVNLWPHMVMLDVLMSHYDYSNDPRVLPLIKRFFEFCRDLPDARFIPPRPGQKPPGGWNPYVQYDRAGDMLAALCWFHNHTGEAGVLDLARRFFARLKPADGDCPDPQGVNFTHRFRYFAEYGALTGDPARVAQTGQEYAQHLAAWGGRMPRGIFAADDHIRPGKIDPRQGFETCALVEFAKSFHILGRLTGNPIWADHCEDIMLNHFPAAQTPDLKALHHLTAANMPQLDRSEKHDFFNRGRLLDYSPHGVYRCCQHNVAMGWPSYVQNLWQATSDGGLAAWLYGDCEVTARVGDPALDQDAVFETRTDYPFSGAATIELIGGGGHFPLYLRVPRWCPDMKVQLNGTPLPVQAPAGQFLCIQYDWRKGDRLSLNLPMTTALTRWPESGAVTVDRGPLSYSVRIEEEWRSFGGSKDWPEWEVFPRSPWNYGLVLAGGAPAAGLEVTEREEISPNPWTVANAPVEIRARARRIPGWKLGPDQTVEPLPQSPVASDEPDETITLIPLGCARLRLACLPVTGPGPH